MKVAPNLGEDFKPNEPSLPPLPYQEVKFTSEYRADTSFNDDMGITPATYEDQNWLKIDSPKHATLSEGDAQEEEPA